MGFQDFKNDIAIGNGGAGTPEVWDIIDGSVSTDLGGRIVTAFMSLDENGGTFTEMEEETTIAHGGKAGASTAVAAKYLGYTYPQYIPFEGRYTKLTATRGCKFKVWFLK
jgi:hypothetical protein